jgi:DNA invertase Pin-like site-specific DNA recombinase
MRHGASAQVERQRAAPGMHVRQSTLRQVLENTESTRRQYALRQRAVALGWPNESVVVIDSDLGQSGASTDREGFQKLVRHPHPRRGRHL